MISFDKEKYQTHKKEKEKKSQDPLHTHDKNLTIQIYLK